ncbi:MAG: hypothetical protein BWY98_00140 [Tenericutes bacterium ADurb.BinA155]|jgi:hypothetical protein|nr:MAG: hypothetical protein BWY98_00140 [Tenericutes bacterium ADurb.BinA155]
MANKFMKKAIVAFAILSATSVLASCDTIKAKLPDSEYSSKILELDGITNNTLKRIYDAVVTEGDANSGVVLDNVLLALAEDQFGSFYELKDIITDDTKIADFAKNHSVYTDSDSSKMVLKVKYFYNSLLRRINEAFFGYTTNTNYAIRSIFYEQKFYVAEKADLYDLGTLTTFKEVQIDGADTADNVAKYFATDYLTVYKDYINRAILPAVMRKAIIEQYLYTKNYGTLGRSYARKVQYIALADSDYQTHTGKLMQAFAKDVINDATLCNTYDLSLLGDLYKGYFDWANMDATKKTLVTKIYDDAGYTKFTAAEDPSGKFVDTYKGTTYGGYIEDYLKITDDRSTNDTTKEKDFTGSGAYTKEVGMQIKQQALVAIDKTTDGWYTSSGLSSLPSDLKSRLFKIGVANEVDSGKTGELDYGYYINGHYYLTSTVYQNEETSTSYPYVIYDKTTTTWYLIRVDEAVKISKLGDGTGSYDTMAAHSGTDQTYWPIFRETVAREVAYLLSDTDTYKKSANQYYVDQAAIAYHDDYVYNYFKTTFPDLFD